MEQLLPILLILLAVVLLFYLLQLPVRWLLKITVNTILGFALLLAFNWIGRYINLSLGASPLNALIIGILGIPGFVMLLLIRWLLLV